MRSIPIRLRALRAIPLLALGLAFGLGETAAAQDTDHADHDHQLIRINENRVRPDPQQIHANDAVGWLNYTSKIARVSFDKEVGKHLTCTSPGSFRLDGERLVSGDIQATQFATLCNLAPGEYTYRVTLRSGIGSSGGVDKQLEGTIVVGE